MGFKKGHSFPTSAGFSNSSGKVQAVKGYTRSRPKSDGVKGAAKMADGGMLAQLANKIALTGRAPPQRIPGPTSSPKTPPGPPVKRPFPGPMSSPKTPPGSMPRTLVRPVKGIQPVRGGMAAYADGGKVEKVGDQGNAVTQRPPIAEVDRDYGGRSPLRPGFKKGGKAFSRSPMFGKK